MFFFFWFDFHALMSFRLRSILLIAASPPAAAERLPEAVIEAEIGEGCLGWSADSREGFLPKKRWLGRTELVLLVFGCKLFRALQNKDSIHSGLQKDPSQPERAGKLFGFICQCFSPPDFAYRLMLFWLILSGTINIEEINWVIFLSWEHSYIPFILGFISELALLILKRFLRLR